MIGEFVAVFAATLFLSAPVAALLVRWLTADPEPDEDGDDGRGSA